MRPDQHHISTGVNGVSRYVGACEGPQIALLSDVPDEYAGVPSPRQYNVGVVMLEPGGEDTVTVSRGVPVSLVVLPNNLLSGVVINSESAVLSSSYHLLQFLIVIKSKDMVIFFFDNINLRS